MTDATEPTVVTQADADLVADLLTLADQLDIEGNDIASIRNGIWNDEPGDLGRLLRLAARHRLAEQDKHNG